MWSRPEVQKLLTLLRVAGRPLLQPISFFGLAAIILLWAGLHFHLNFVRDKAEQTAIQTTANLAHAFEEHVARMIADLDWTIQIFRAEYLKDPAQFHMEQLPGPASVKNDMIVQIALIGPDGIVKESTLGRQVDGIDVSDREYFRALAEGKDDELFISKPLLGRASNQWVIQLARGIRDADGAFAGAMTASLDPHYLIRFYESINLGKGGAVRLIGLDRVVRAQGGFKTDLIGQTIVGSKLFGKLAEAPAGSYTGSGGTTDGTERLLSYRALKNYPLVVTVGLSLEDIFSEYETDWRFLYSVTAALTLLILAVIVASARRSAKLLRTREALRVSQSRAQEKSRELEITLDHMDQGLMMVDPQGTIAVVNNRAVELLDLPPIVRMRPKHQDIATSRFASGEYGEDGGNLPPEVRKMLQASVISAEVPLFERTRPNGVVIEVRSEALPEGGVVRTFTDITERKQHEAQISHMAYHDPLTGLANRALFEDRINQALGRLRRLKEGFTVLCLDLDRFKSVNDTYGHAAGDTLLRAVADRLSQCVREMDTVARVGGDEFVMLLATSARAEEVSIVAERIVRSVSAPYDLGGPQVTIGISAGIAMASDPDADVDKLLQNADAALYRAKSIGGSGYAFFEESMVASTVPSTRIAS